jgi:shikimate dehydrogenase
MSARMRLPAPPAALFGIIGHPLGHSASPALHTWAFARAGVAAAYMAWPLPPEKLRDFFLAARTLPIRGGNITLPHKAASLPLLDSLSARARRVGAVNVFYLDGERLCGDNTDVAGFCAPIARRRIARALVLGAGGAARAVLAGLRELGTREIGVCNRTDGKAESLAREFGAFPVPWADRAASGAGCIINTTTLGMAGENADASPLPAGAFAGKGLAYDIIYNPLKTRFLREAELAGWETVDGLAMFVEQARESFRLWNPGRDFPPGEARALVSRLLGNEG